MAIRFKKPRPPSLRVQVRKVFEEDGAQAAEKFGLDAGAKPPRLARWLTKWSKATVIVKGRRMPHFNPNLRRVLLWPKCGGPPWKGVVIDESTEVRRVRILESEMEEVIGQDRFLTEDQIQTI